MIDVESAGLPASRQNNSLQIGGGGAIAERRGDAMEELSVTWATPGGMHILEQTDPIVGEPCLLVLEGGPRQLGQLLQFDPQESHFLFRGNRDPGSVEVAISSVLWMRLLRPVHLLKSQSLTPFTDAEWRCLLKPVAIHFEAAEALVGEAAALFQNQKGWFFFLVKDTGQVYRYFIPHDGIERILLNGEAQQRFDSATPIRGKMKNPRLADILCDSPEKYPYALEARFERILDRIMTLWNDSSALQSYFEELMVDKRGERQGFPQDVARDIFTLSGIYDELSRRSQVVDPWAAERAKGDLDHQGHAFTPQHFHHVVERNNYTATLLYLDAGMAVDTPGEVGWTPLLVASFNGNEAIAELLLQRGADPYALDAAGHTPLHWAAFNGFARVTRLLIGKRVNVDAANRYGWTPLLQAAARGHTEVVGMLLEAGADANLADQEGWSPLHKAVVNRHDDVVDLLLARGANVRAVHKSGVTPLQLAADKGYVELHQRLTKA
jgi:hypothetical protein